MQLGVSILVKRSREPGAGKQWEVRIKLVLGSLCLTHQKQERAENVAVLNTDGSCKRAVQLLLENTQHNTATVSGLTRHSWIEDGSLCMQKGSQTCSPAREPFPSKPLWTLGAPKRAGSPPIDSFVIKQTKMWAGIRKLELPYRDSVATSPPFSFQSCLAIFKSNTRLSLGLESQSLKEHSVSVSCYIVMLHSQLATPWILKYHISSGWDHI